MRLMIAGCAVLIALNVGARAEETAGKAVFDGACVRADTGSVKQRKKPWLRRSQPQGERCAHSHSETGAERELHDARGASGGELAEARVELLAG